MTIGAPANVGSSFTLTENPVTISVDCGSGANRTLHVGIGMRGGIGTPGGTISSVTYNGVSMLESIQVQQDTAGRDYRAALFHLNLPDSTTGAHDLVVTFAGSLVNNAYQWWTCAGSVGTLTLDDTGSGTGNSEAPTSQIDPTSDNQLVLGFAVSEDNSPMTTGAGETTILNQDPGVYVASSSYDIQTTAESQHMDYTSTATDWAAVSASFFEEGGAVAASLVANLPLAHMMPSLVR